MLNYNFKSSFVYFDSFLDQNFSFCVQKIRTHRSSENSVFECLSDFFRFSTSYKVSLQSSTVNFLNNNILNGIN